MTHIGSESASESCFGYQAKAQYYWLDSNKGAVDAIRLQPAILVLGDRGTM